MRTNVSTRLASRTIHFLQFEKEIKRKNLCCCQCSDRILDIMVFVSLVHCIVRAL